MQSKKTKKPIVKTKKKIVYKYKFRKDYNPVYANGAYGGVSSKGEIVINFFNERQAIPYEAEHEIIGNQLSDQVITKPVGFNGTHHVRFIENGVTLNLETAKAIRSWLDKHIAQLEGINNVNRSKKS